MTTAFFNTIKHKLIASCQALEEEPLHGADIMAKMATAAKMGGATAIRANSVVDIQAIRNATKLPLIGIIKQEYAGSDVFITPTLKEVEALTSLQIDCIALDATARPRPGGGTLEQLISFIHSQGVLVMGDISTLEEAKQAEALGVDCVGTTLSGYTPYSRQLQGPDLTLIRDAALALSIPVIAEGKIHTTEDAKQAMLAGAHAVVVGSAISRPQLITKRFVTSVESVFHPSRESQGS
ncbi:N-acetylmannosamine-6-phosphate 2-epimerase [Aureibacillus halotolerans]|uniref:Putative N-acetylmannosamine-6-phosphate 2-epimerase n=1 Tax=Aureibacillus halotolerans TaxID=1508390 RepID=A0A4R6UIM2_9BACI|nr:N-acetylmannosamine-6-phosphate 2-epimerase [Aureibacillus halotolerans]TDQ43024.1 N-acylglucosamine-6-phosphate 2-epimerase [Aureibacillus halotolerans]